MKCTHKNRLFLVLALAASGCSGNLDGDRARESDAGAGLDAAIVDANTASKMPLVPLFDAASPGALQCSRDPREVANPVTGASTPCPPDKGCFAVFVANG